MQVSSTEAETPYGAMAATGPQRNYFHLSWNIGAANTVVLPFLMYLIAVIVKGPREEGGSNDNNNNQDSSSFWWWKNNNDDDNGNNDDGNNNNNNQGGNDENENDSGWWWWQNGEERGGPDEDAGQGAVIFVYLWCLLMFGTLVWYGNVTFRQDAPALPLLVALAFFSNLSFVCLILVARLGINYEDRELEERGWLAQFGACVTLTFAFYLLYCCVFFILIRRRTDTQQQYVAPNNNDNTKNHTYEYMT